MPGPWNLTFYPNPVLKQECKTVTAFDDDLRALVSRMFEVMTANRGVGLAAPQVGDTRRVFVVDCGAQHGGRMVLVNPEVVTAAGKETDTEGCLSLPSIHIDVTRPARVRLRAADLDGTVREIDAEALLARAFQHELDHLNGVMLTDKMGMLQRMSNRKTLRELEEDHAAGRYPPRAKIRDDQEQEAERKKAEAKRKAAEAAKAAK